MARRPAVDEELCIGCGHCAEICPQVFELENERSVVIGPDRCASCSCQEAIDTCPVQAIRWDNGA